MIPLAARRKVMNAAGEVETSTVREAAIVGAIVRCACSTGRYNGPWISQTTSDILHEFRLLVDRTPPCMAEVGMMVERFEAAYGRKFTA